jgi:hypothetical protein
MIVTVSVLGVLTLALFVLTFVFYGKFQGEKLERQSYETSVSEFIRSDERQRDDVQAMLSAARPTRKSLVTYMSESMQTTMRRVTGSPRDTVANLEEKLARIPGADGTSLVQLIGDLNANIQQLPVRPGRRRSPAGSGGPRQRVRARRQHAGEPRRGR